MSDGIHGIKILKGKVHIMKTIEEFYSEAMADKELEVAVNKAHSENRLAEFLTEHGVDGTTEAFEALVKEKKQTRTELTDKELEEAVGGKDGYADWGVDWSDNGYVYDKSKVKFLFNVGDKVNHKKFGDGIIISINGDICKISFAGIGIKELMLSFAPLTKI